MIKPLCRILTKNVAVVGIFGKIQIHLSEYRSVQSDYRSVGNYTPTLEYV